MRIKTGTAAGRRHSVAMHEVEASPFPPEQSSQSVGGRHRERMPRHPSPLLMVLLRSAETLWAARRPDFSMPSLRFPITGSRKRPYRLERCINPLNHTSEELLQDSHRLRDDAAELRVNVQNWLAKISPLTFRSHNAFVAHEMKRGAPHPSPLVVLVKRYSKSRPTTLYSIVRECQKPIPDSVAIGPDANALSSIAQNRIGFMQLIAYSGQVPASANLCGAVHPGG